MPKMNPELRAFFRDWGKIGGKAKARGMTAADRAKVGKMLAEARKRKRGER